MTASRAHRRGPSPSPPHDAHTTDGHVPTGRTRPGDAAVLPVRRPRLVRTTVPAHPSRAAGVRTMVAECLTHLRLPEHLDNAVLATDELFANAVRHGSPGPGDWITVTLECTEHQLRVTVADRSLALPRPRAMDAAEESGRGLAIVGALTDDWGIAPPEPGTTGKKVWFTLTLRGMP
ncbi:ATP-binding protein [Streptomyces sp. NBC_01136]|uniref:ATP-binding protein n=1 Tax=unclassified Streptomyces TaxID=2593676 RepID=UPI003255470A|nr:ATP-binding protein [Streptomyces sp. NBC_01136]